MIRRVVGNSMLPNLRPGSIVVGSTKSKPKVGNLVIVKYEGKEIVKRLKDIKDDKLFIVGDNQQESSDSRIFGWLSKNQLIATVIWPRNA